MYKYPIVNIKTEDGVTLSGLITTPEEPSDTIIINIHGTAGNFFYNSFYKNIAEMAYKSGITFLATNNRGAGVYELENGAVPTGAALEKFEDSVLDIDAWIRFATDMGYKEIILEGHSFGTEKIVYYMSKGKSADKISSVILLGFSDSVGTQRKYEEKVGKNYLEEARQLLKDGNGESLLSDKYAMCGEIPISAQTYVSFFGENSELSITLPFRSGKLVLFKNIKVPTLCVISDDEGGEYTIVPIKDAIEILKRENSLAFTQQIADTDHGFNGKEKALTTLILDFVAGHKQ